MTCGSTDGARWAHTLEEWAEPCSSFQMTWTRDVVSDALRGARRLEHCEYEVFVQGSFANNTHTSPTSDVDIVVMMTMPLEENISALDGRGRSNFAERYEPSGYGWSRFRSDVVATMRSRYFLSEGKRCLSIKHWDSLLRVPADVLPAIEYRNYRSFPRPGREEYDEGVHFRHRNGTAIVNHPKQHLANGRAKERATGGRSKALVRIVKNARDHLASCEEHSPSGRALMAATPSYYLECLVHHVPDPLFRGPLPDAAHAVTTWLADRSAASGWSSLRCQNGLVDLFGRGPDQWDADTAGAVVRCLRDLFDRPRREREPSTGRR